MLAETKFLMLVAIVIAYLTIWTVRRNKIMPPGPFALPLIGSVRSLFQMERFDLYLLEVCKEFGRTFNLKTQLGDCIFVTSPENCEHILATKFKNYPKGETLQYLFRDWFGEGIFAVDGHQWKVQRKTSSHIFTTKSLREEMAPVFVDHIEEGVRTLGKAADSGEVVNITQFFLNLTMNTFGQIAFGVDLSDKDAANTLQGFGTAFDQTGAYVSGRQITPGWPLFRYLNIGSESKLKEWADKLNVCCYQIIKERKELIRNGGSLEHKTDLLSKFMKLIDDNGEPYSDQYLRDIIANFIAAGRDTTALALNWTVYSLCNTPDAKNAFFKEVDNVMGDKNISYAIANELDYGQALVMETLRLYPSVPRDAKCAIEDDVLPDGNVFVPKGTHVFFCPFIQGRLSEVWGEDCEQYRPERFVNLNADEKPSQYKLNAFQGGPRVCMGVQIAYLEAKMTLAAIYKRFDFELTTDEHPGYALSALLQPTRPIMVLVNRRATTQVSATGAH